MTIHSLYVQLKQYGSLFEGAADGDDDSGFLNGLHTRCKLPVRSSFAGIFAAMKEYFRPVPPSAFIHANHTLADRAITIDVESTGSFDLGQASQCTRTIKSVALVAAAAGIAAATYLVHSALYVHEDKVELNFTTPDALSVTLVTAALIGRQLLSIPTVTNAIANQCVFVNAPFNLQVDLSQVFNYTENLADVRFSQADGAPLPGWLTMSFIPSLVGSRATTDAQNVAVIDNYAYVADTVGGLRIIDVSNKESPTLVESVMIRYVRGIAVNGNYAYVAAISDGLRIIDVNNKTNPTPVGNITTVYASGVTVVGNYAYVVEYCDGFLDYCDGLKIIDINSKASPILVGSIATKFAYGIAINGNYAYLTHDNYGGLKIIDVSNKMSPTLVGSIAMSAFDVAVVDNYAYVASDGLQIIDINNKTNPVLVGSIATYHATGAASIGVAVNGNYAYVACDFGGLRIIDISNKTSPTLVGNVTNIYANGVIFSDNSVYVAARSDGIKIFSLDKIVLSGTPASLNRGPLPIKLTITDTSGETASSYFSITVLSNPPTAPAIEPQTVHHAFDWVIPEFSDSDGNLLTYTATLIDGLPLPDWISFNSTTRNLSGTVPPVVTVRKINIQANDSYGGIANATQTISVVNLEPTAGPSALPSQNFKSTVPFNFSLNPNLFIDPDGDPLTYSASLQNQQPLPDWLTFNQTSEIFTGMAPAGAAGLMSVIITAADPFGATIARSFDLNVVGSNKRNNLPKRIQNPHDYSVGIGHVIYFQISNNTFFDADNDPLTWSASVTEGNALPAWLNFDGDSRYFYGTAPNTPQKLPIVVQAEDWQHIPATANFNFFVEGAPQLVTQLPNLPAHVGTEFIFVVPANTFQDLGIQGAMTYTVTLTTGAVLPAWLTFDPTTRIFAGTPGRKDTDAFSSKPLFIRLTANNSIGANSVDFIINVQGESNTTLAIKIISGVGATLAITGAVYAKRNFVWKKSMQCVYRLPTEYVVFGQESEYCHSITRLNPEKVGSVKLLRDGQFLPGEISLPDWLIFDNSSVKLTIDALALHEQEGLTISRWTVQVKNKGGYVNHLVWEEFDIIFVRQLLDLNADNKSQHMGGSIAMKSVKSRREQLRQPLINYTNR